MPTKKPKPDLVKAADNFSRKYEDVFGDKDPQDIINELRGDGDVSGASMNSSGESAAREREAEALARMFHETYERLAPEFGYKTREESAVPWEQVPDNNKRLMIAVCGEIARRYTAKGDAG